MKLLEESVNECRAIVGMLLKQHEIIGNDNNGPADRWTQSTSPNHHGRNDSDGSFEHST